MVSMFLEGYDWDNRPPPKGLSGGFHLRVPNYSRLSKQILPLVFWREL